MFYIFINGCHWLELTDYNGIVISYSNDNYKYKLVLFFFLSLNDCHLLHKLKLLLLYD